MGDTWPFGPPNHVTWNAAYAAMNSLGVSPEDCAVYAAIAQAESGLDLAVVNDTPATGDYSVGLWQINYFGSLYSERSAAYGTPQQLVQGGIGVQALAAFSIGQGGFTPWSTYNSGAYLAYLNGNVAPSGAPPGGASPPTLSIGSAGPYVVQLQSMLDILGYGLAQDGQFGPLTQAAVIQFQTSAHIGIDGIVGPQTWQALSSAVAFAQGGANPGPTTIPGGSPPPSQPPGNVDPSVIGSWSNLVAAGGTGLGSTLASLAAYASTLGGL